MSANELHGPWDSENWREAAGIRAPESETNSALAERNYRVPCLHAHPIGVIKGYYLWWCSTHHQPLSWCDKGRALQTVRDAVAEAIR